MTHCKLIWNGFFVLLRLRFSSKMATTISVRVLLRFEKNKRFSPGYGSTPWLGQQI